MREENPCENRTKTSRFSEQNQAKKGTNNPSKLRSSWGSNIVKGFSADKKIKSQNTNIPAKKPPLTGSNIANTTRVKRSLIDDLSYSIKTSQIHPQKSVGSRDLFLELDHLRSLITESKDRELKLQNELNERNTKVVDLERELGVKKSEVDKLISKVNFLECEKRNLSEQLDKSDFTTKKVEGEFLNISGLGSLEIEVVELRRLNKELQLQKRNLSCRLSSMESELASIADASQSENIANIKKEASFLRTTNEDLSKQVEGLQMSRLNEVEELAYLRWVNSCLRNELRNNCSTIISDELSTPFSIEKRRESINSVSSKDEISEQSSCQRTNLIKKLKKWPITEDNLSNSEYLKNGSNRSWDQSRSPSRRHSISGSKLCIEDLVLLNNRRQSDGFICPKEIIIKESEPANIQKYDLDFFQAPDIFSNFQENNKVMAPLDFVKRTLRVPNPPPKPSSILSIKCNKEGPIKIQPPPPPPPPPPPCTNFIGKGATGVVQRAPEVVEFYHSLMKRDSRNNCINGGNCDAPDVENARSSMIGEIENRSSHLLAIKADVETQGEFVNSLIKEVNCAIYQDIEDVLAFVKWLDEELSFLVDERAVLKHFDWPERKADTLREAAFGYRDLKKLESLISDYRDDPLLPCEIALKKMVTLSEKMERTFNNLLRTRESLIYHCKEFHIPTDWMLDNGIVSKIKFGSVKLARIYMKRVALELQAKGTSEKDSALDYMLLQGVRFAFRIHQFAGGFDAETMHAFEELRNLALVLSKK